MTDDQIEELSKVKDEQIKKLTEMKDMLKGKLSDTLLENTKLRAEISSLQLENQNIKMTQSKSDKTGETQQQEKNVFSALRIMDIKLNTISNKMDRNFGNVINKLNDFLGFDENISDVGAEKPRFSEPNSSDGYNPGAQQDYYSSNLGKDKLDLSFQTKSDSFQQTNHLQKPSDRIRQQDAQQKFQPSSFSKNTFQQTEPLEEKERTLNELRKSLNIMNQELEKTEKKEKLEKAEKPQEMVRKSNIFTVPQPKDGVYRCPKCGSQSYQETENHDKILSFVPKKIYAKMYYCKKCRTEWEYGY